MSTSDDEHRAARRDPAYWDAVVDERDVWDEQEDEWLNRVDLDRRVDAGEFEGDWLERQERRDG